MKTSNANALICIRGVNLLMYSSTKINHADNSPRCTTIFIRGAFINQQDVLNWYIAKLFYCSFVVKHDISHRK